MLGTVLGTKDALMSKKDEAGVLIRGNSQSTTIGLLCLHVLQLQIQPPVDQKYYKEKIPECSQK